MDFADILRELEKLRDPDAISGMARFGITPQQAYGVRIPTLRKIAKSARTKNPVENHALALRLWSHDTRETRILASMVDSADLVNEAQMEHWVHDFDYWEICDQCCMNLFEKTPYAYPKAVEWATREPEFEKRAGFVLMARLAVSDKRATDDKFTAFFPLIEQEAGDPRNYVKKGISWALRQIGKRNAALRSEAITVAKHIIEQDSQSARWIARDALNELNRDKA